MLKRILILTATFNILDYFFTLKAVSAGMVEGNPAMEAILHTPLFPAVKLLLVPLMLWVLWRYRERVPRLRYYVWVPFVAYAILTGWHVFLVVKGYN